MWFNTLKKKAIRKSADNTILKAVPTDFNYEFKKVGVVIDKEKSKDISELLKVLDAKGVKKSQVQFLIYSGDSKHPIGEESYFKVKDFNISGNTDKKEILDFTNVQFDLLISYYMNESAPLLWVTAKSQAKFKVGVTSVNTRVNHFSLEVAAIDVKSYVDNLFKYIKVFKK